jgi:protein arginine kinase activator
MKCDQCDQEATVHELRVVNGKKVERHLCEKCARKQNIQVPQQISVENLIEQYMQAAQAAKAQAPGSEKEKPASPKTTACPSCSTTYVEFRQTGLLGCPDCYNAFELQLGPLLERAHEGGSHNVGKMPRRALSGNRPRSGTKSESVLGDAAARAARITTLRAQLDQAVRVEQYERAATLRDELRRLTELQAPEPPAP